MHYFGLWDDPDRALAIYQQWGSDLQSGKLDRIPKNNGNGKETNLQGSPEKEKPPLPWKGFRLFAHPNGPWAKKIRGKPYFFGSWDKPQEAFDLYKEQKEDLYAGRLPMPKSDGLTVGVLVNLFFTAKKRKVKAVEMRPQTFHDYKVVCDLIREHFGPDTSVLGLQPPHFAPLRAKIAKSRRGVNLKNWIIRVRMVFKFAYEERFIERPVHYGQSFNVPSLATIRKIRNETPPRMFEPEQLREVNNEAHRNLKAMTLLGINCGFGITDCGTLPFSAVDLKGGWIDFPRPKTGIQRRIPLWPETIEALRDVIAKRKEPIDPSNNDRVFITQQGTPYIGQKLNDRNPASQRFRELLKKLGYHRPGLNFAALRHNFQTIGEQSGEVVAVQYMMGHAPDNKDMSAIYQEKVFEDKLLKAVNHIHDLAVRLPSRQPNESWPLFTGCFGNTRQDNDLVIDPDCPRIKHADDCEIVPQWWQVLGTKQQLFR
jgi:integrase